MDVLLHRLCERRDEYLGSLVIFELIDMCREFLTENNKPASKCAICLLDIVDADSFVKTVCYHYFHSCCLGQYVRIAMEEHEEDLRYSLSVSMLNISCPFEVTSKNIYLQGESGNPRENRGSATRNHVCRL